MRGKNDPASRTIHVKGSYYGEPILREIHQAEGEVRCSILEEKPQDIQIYLGFITKSTSISLFFRGSAQYKKKKLYGNHKFSDKYIPMQEALVKIQ